MQTQLDNPLAIEVTQALNRAADQLEKFFWLLEDKYDPLTAAGMFPNILQMYWGLRREADAHYPASHEVENC